MAEYIDRTQLALTAIDITDLPEDKALLVYEKEEVEGLPTADVIERSKIDKAIEEIIEKSFISDIYNDRTDEEIIKVDDVLEILKRNLEGK